MGRCWTVTAFNIGLLLAGFAAASPVQAQPVGDFYRGKTINLLVGTGPGGEYDLIARMVAKYVGRHLPGNPTVVVQNMAGASGLKMANFLATAAPQDGTTLGIVQNGLIQAQTWGLPGIQFDVTKFHWLGAIAPITETIAVWHTAGVKTVDDLRRRETIVGASARGGMTFGFPNMMNELVGTRFKIVHGYQGGNQINLAMERREVEARNNSWSSWKTTKADWLKDGRIVVVVQGGPRAADLAAPSVEDFARTPDDRRVMELILAGTQVGRPFTITPGTPADRVAALRAAFDAVMTDRDFRTEAEGLQMEIAPIPGAELNRIAAQVVATPKATAERARSYIE